MLKKNAIFHLPHFNQITGYIEYDKTVDNFMRILFAGYLRDASSKRVVPPFIRNQGPIWPRVQNGSNTL